MASLGPRTRTVHSAMASGFAFDLAVMTASPAPSIKTRPVLATRATSGLEEVHSTSAKGAPCASKT